MQAKVQKRKECVMAGKFELYEDKAGEYRFRLKAGNGETILVGEGYKQKASAENGIASIRTNATIDARYERKTTIAGKPMFNLKASNGQVIGTSESYSSEAARENGIASVKANAPDARLDDLT
ncbi:YegP family protein [Salipiger sp. P9]|nr:YegP family protein [Salipiger pentaromativorans]MCR8547816.1 YegP family protein [Salipiger pentaromativorans]